LLAEKLEQRDRLQNSVIAAFIATPNWNEARSRFDRMDELVRKLSEEDFEQIKAAYEANDQLHNAIYLHNAGRLRKFLLRTTGNRFTVNAGKIRPDSKKEGEEIPF
jgi:hypothetical protein